MAWRCTGSTNEALIDNMWRSGLITDARVKEAFLKVLSEDFALLLV
jgi:protein-L-isoaspartate(D-aspartate) O-methyltransferase